MDETPLAKLSVRIPETLAIALKVEAAQGKQSLQDYVTEILCRRGNHAILPEPEEAGA